MRLILYLSSLLLFTLLSFGADPAVCGVHDEKMTSKVVPIQYGLPAFTPYGEKLRKAEAELFPNAVDYVLGGCVLREEKTEAVQECATCRKRKEEWLLKNPPPKS